MERPDIFPSSLSLSPLSLSLSLSPEAKETAIFSLQVKKKVEQKVSLAVKKNKMWDSAKFSLSL